MAPKKNSLHKVQAGSTPYIADLFPEPGAICFSEHDGGLYFADADGWKQMLGPVIAQP